MLALNDNDEVIFTRRGDLQVSPNGILTNGAGERILSEDLEPFELPAFKDISVAPNGEVLLDTMDSQKARFPRLVFSHQLILIITSYIKMWTVELSISVRTKLNRIKPAISFKGPLSYPMLIRF